MNSQEHLQLMEELAEEQRHPDTIFLRKYSRGWIAYEHSARLLHHYFAPAELQETTGLPIKLVCAVWQGSVSIRESPNAREFYFSSRISDRMTIQCPPNTDLCHGIASHSDCRPTEL